MQPNDYDTLSVDELLNFALGGEVYAVYKSCKAAGVEHVVRNLACLLGKETHSAETETTIKLLMRYSRLFRTDEAFRKEQFTNAVLDAARDGINIEQYIARAEQEQRLRKSHTSS